MSTKNLVAEAWEPDAMDANCSIVMDALKFMGTNEYKIEVLEQVIDYLRMDAASE